jgi:hypothetical protein
LFPLGIIKDTIFFINLSVSSKIIS